MTVAFTSSPLALVAGAFFTILLVVACVTDVRSRRIPNVVVLVLAVTGLLYSAATAPMGIAALGGFRSCALGFVIWIPLYALGMMGAGDVKLFAAASAWLTPVAVINAALVSAFVGGVLALIWMFRAYGGAMTVMRLSHAASRPSVLRQPLLDGAPATKLPYGVAMAFGLALAAWLPRFPF